MDFAKMRRHDGLVAAVVTYFATLTDDFRALTTFREWGRIYEKAEPGSMLEERCLTELRKLGTTKLWQRTYQLIVTGPRLKALAWSELVRISKTCEDWCWLFGRDSPATMDEDILYYRRAKGAARSSKDFHEVLKRLIGMIEVKYAADAAPDLESHPDYDDLLNDIRILQRQVVATARTYDDWYHIGLGTNRWEQWYADAMRSMARLASKSSHFSHLYYQTEDPWYWREAVRRARTFDDWIALFCKTTPKSKTLYRPAYTKAKKLARGFRDWRKIYCALPFDNEKERQKMMARILKLKLRRRDWDWLIHLRHGYPNLMVATLEYMRKTHSFRQLWKHAWHKDEILALMREKGGFDDWRKLFLWSRRHQTDKFDTWRVDTACAEMLDAVRTPEQCREAAKLFEPGSDIHDALISKAATLLG